MADIIYATKLSGM